MAVPSQPPALPSDVLQRVVTIARLDGWSVVGIATVGTIVAAVMGDRTGALIGAGVAAAGGLELAGVRALGRGRAGGVNALVASQLMLLLLIWGYAGLRLWAGTDALVDQVLTPERVARIAGLGVDTRLLDELLRRTLPLTYGVIVLATLGYQGGLALFYHRKRGSIGTALG